MPYGAMIDLLARQLTAEALTELVERRPEVAARMGEAGSLVDVAVDILNLEDHQRAYLEAIPSVLREAIRAAIVEAVAGEKGVQVQYSPAYDFAVRVWDYGDAVGIHVSGPYPPEFPKDGFQRPGS